MLNEKRINEYKQYLESTLSHKRYHHSLCVADEALKLAKIFGADEEKSYVCGLLHDICKEISTQDQLDLMNRGSFEISETEMRAPKTYHAIAGAVFVKEKFGITDADMLNAMRFHTVARGNMSLLEKVLYMADLISADRVYDDVDRIREITYSDIDRGMYEAMCFSVNYSVEHKRTIPIFTLEAYNEYMLKELARLDRA